MITAFFTPYYKFLQKDSYLKFFSDVESLSDLVSKIKVEDKIKIYAHSKDIIKFQFNNTNPNIEYEFLEDEFLFDKFINNGDKVKVNVKQQWQNILGEYIYIVQDRNEQINIVKNLDKIVIQATDINDLKDNLVHRNGIGELLTSKMFFTDEELGAEGISVSSGGKNE